MERVAPRQIMYENQLPLAIESKSQRRIFYPEGTSNYGGQGNTDGNPTTIRIPINADSLLDVQHSYLQFKLKNNAANNRTAGYDFGVPIIRRLRIESAGTTLEDIDNYNRLYGGVLFPAQSSVGAVKDASITQMGMVAAQGTTQLSDITAFTGAAAPGNTAANINAAIDAATAEVRVKVNAMTATNTGFNGAHETDTDQAHNSERVYNVVLASGLLNMDKYLPLVMMNAGLVLELELESAGNIACWSGAGANYVVSDVKYIAHLIDLQRDFYDKLRMVMEGSGGVLQLTGTTYRNYTSTHAANTTSAYDINIPARVKSIKSILFNFSEGDAIDRFTIGNSQPNGVSEYQFRVGSVVYPPTSVKVSATNKGEAYQELRKAFGTLGDYQHGGFQLDDGTFYSAAAARAAQSSGGAILTPFALDFESFPKTALENGINSADRSLPITLEVKRTNTGPNIAMTCNVWVMCDAVFYVNLDGSVSVSI